MKLEYHWEGDYLIPNLLLPEEPKIGIWGKRRADYLRKQRNPIYVGMQLAGKLNAHLEEVDKSANDMLDLLIRQMAEREGVTEQLKAQNQVLWVQRMNSIRQRGEEIVYQELIYS